MEEIQKDYYPGSISFAQGFSGPPRSVGFFMEADQEQAHTIIRNLIESGRNVSYAEMGLDGDWGCNSCMVYEDGEFKNYTVHRSSCWAKPIVIIHFTDHPSETYSVWKQGEPHTL